MSPREAEQGPPVIIGWRDQAEQVLDSVGLDVARGVIRADVDGHTAHMVFDAHDCAIDAGRKRTLAPVVVGGDMPAVGAQARTHACSSVVCRIKRAGARRVQQLAAHDTPTPQCLDGCRRGCASCLCSVHCTDSDAIASWNLLNQFSSKIMTMLRSSSVFGKS